MSEAALAIILAFICVMFAIIKFAPKTQEISRRRHLEKAREDWKLAGAKAYREYYALLRREHSASLDTEQIYIAETVASALEVQKHFLKGPNGDLLDRAKHDYCIAYIAGFVDRALDDQITFDTASLFRKANTPSLVQLAVFCRVFGFDDGAKFQKKANEIMEKNPSVPFPFYMGFMNGKADWARVAAGEELPTSWIDYVTGSNAPDIKPATESDSDRRG